ncbi:MAG: adenylate/guanylate cyclase domain-containing protein [Ruminiclostridium sp.]|nr:adenylate/guanylate cyclase domain-containing protein [Ruminiclostridium sp.]
MNKNKKIRIAAGTAICFILAFVVSFFDLFGVLDLNAKDLLYQQPRGTSSSIKIIAIDDSDESRATLGNYGTWKRDVYARVIEALGDYPTVIALDLLMLGEIDAETDAQLVEACKKSGRIVTADYINYTAQYEKNADGSGYINYTHIDSVSEPIIADCAELGFVNVSVGDDGVMRNLKITEEYDGRTMQHFAYRTYTRYCELTGIPANTPALDSAGRMWIDYAGRPHDYEYIPITSVLDGSVDPRAFRDCIVLVGAYALGLRDEYDVPNSADQMFGVEINANIVQALMDGRSPVPANRVIAALLCSVIAAAIFFATGVLNVRTSTPLFIAVVLLWCGACFLLWQQGTIMPLIYTPIFAALAYFAELIFNYVEESLEKRRIISAFRKYVAPQVVENIAKSGNYKINLGGERKHIAVLFVDIRGFTTMSESLEPEQVVDIVNTYLNLTTNSIFANDGTLDKFVGDATMAVFNAPFDLDDYVFRAVKTAMDIVAGSAAIEEKFMAKYGKSVGFGVGVNCGDAVVGNMGCDFRMDYTAMGDTVNTAARLEANAKRGQILISSEVYERVKDRITADPIGEIPLKGKSVGVFVYSVTGMRENQ